MKPPVCFVDDADCEPDRLYTCSQCGVTCCHTHADLIDENPACAACWNDAMTLENPPIPYAAWPWIRNAQGVVIHHTPRTQPERAA